MIDLVIISEETWRRIWQRWFKLVGDRLVERKKTAEIQVIAAPTHVTEVHILIVS